MRKWLVQLLALALLVVCLSACGGDKKAEYAGKINNAVTQDFGSKIETLAASASKSSDASSALDSVPGDLRALATEVTALKAPDDATAQDAQRIASALRDFASSIANKGDFDLALKLVQSRIQSALADLNGRLA